MSEGFTKTVKEFSGGEDLISKNKLLYNYF